MVLYWKLVCAVCGCDPPDEENHGFKDLRDTEPYFDLAKSFKVAVRIFKYVLAQFYCVFTI